jgi:GNAT superfamily N-acetyltransferase
VITQPSFLDGLWSGFSVANDSVQPWSNTLSADTIRLAGPDDVDAFRRIRLEALRAEPAAFSSTAAKWEALSDEEWRRRLAEPVFIAFLDHEPVGIMGLMRQHSSKMAHRATIVMVYVRENLRGAGLATALLDALTSHARELGIRQLELAVNAANPAAVGFYRRKGFAEIDRIPGGFVHDGKETDKIMMARRIDG